MVLFLFRLSRQTRNDERRDEVERWKENLNWILERSSSLITVELEEVLVEIFPRSKERVSLRVLAVVMSYTRKRT
jgi:hypothetical protein